VIYKNKKIAIIGGGIVGLAVAYKLSQRQAKVYVFEKESSFGFHQSGRNSGVLHCGLAYKPGSLKAKLSTRGINEMVDFCQIHNIAHDICGKVVVATNSQEEKALLELAARGDKNGLKGLKFLTAKELMFREPFVRAEKSLLVPQEGIVDYLAVMSKMIQLIEQNDGVIFYNSKIETVSSELNEIITLKTKEEEFSFDYLISCTGLWSDKTYKNLTLKKSPIKIVPFRGEYLKFKKEYEDRVNHLVYPVPDSKYPFLGVHFTRMIDGSKEVGPNAVLALKREGYDRNSFSFRDAIESVTYPGLLKFVSKNFNFSINEFKSSLFMRDFVIKAQKMIPDINESMLERGPSGIRAQAISPDGELQMDFNIERHGRQIHILNAPSPGATASLAIATYIIENYLK
tara:strand:+ start:306 stop:1505 length:1200 start_codon:yes stop_codon:yes gene_type:complete